jgi:ABC-2 type transport system permease protein
MRAVTTSMLLFFVFFTGASAAQSIVREREEGTLARLLSTPTRPATILAGKALAVAVILAAQTATLLAASAALFGIRWGRPGPLVLACGTLVLAAAGFGLLLMSLIRSSRQVGLVLGVGLTVTGMLGGLFTNFIPGIPDIFHTVGLATPQGWAVRLWKLALGGASLRELAVPAGVLAAIGAGCYAAGVLLQRRRLA